MKIVLAAMLIAGFVGIAVFGFFTMHMGDDGHMGCIAAAASGGNCPIETSALPFFNFHLNALRSFSTATFTDSISGLLLTLLFATFGAGIGTMLGGSGIAEPNFAYQWYRSKEFNPLPKRELIHWLSLLEHSPSIS